MGTFSLTTGIFTLKRFNNLLKFFITNNVNVKIYCDNAGTIMVIKGKNVTDKSRHMELKYFFARQRLRRDRWMVDHADGDEDPADILTKSVSVKVFENIKRWLFSEELRDS
eukprot:snap_masked-scaffold_3-processed-gene-1.38-mRNA-1 protein AED:1.00 eAED:1.00 QI:0/-1/0/0/-1/1/1/0/110